MADRDARIRDEAYRMWVEAGRPDGGDQHYWYEAEKRIAEGDKAGGPAKAKSPRKAAGDAAPVQTPDTGAAKAAGAGKKPVATARKGDVEGATSAPAPGPAGASRAPSVKVVAKNAGNGGVAAPARAPSKGERVEVAPVKTPIRAPKKPAASPKPKSG